MIIQNDMIFTLQPNPIAIIIYNIISQYLADRAQLGKLGKTFSRRRTLDSFFFAEIVRIVFEIRKHKYKQLLLVLRYRTRIYTPQICIYFFMISVQVDSSRAIKTSVSNKEHNTLQREVSKHCHTHISHAQSFRADQLKES